MIEELRTYRVTCNGCKEAVIIHESILTIPEGWQAKTEMLGMFKSIKHYCPECSNVANKMNRK